MNKHTPGPWDARKIDDQEWSIDSGVGDYRINTRGWIGLSVAYGSDDFPEIGKEVVEANARLIAAAPDLLEVLEKVQAWMDGGDDDELAYEIDLALTKAKGE